MSRIFSLPLTLTALGLAGCASVAQQVQAKFDPTPARTREFRADYRTVVSAAQQAMKAIGYKVDRASVGDGIVVGHSPIQPGDPTRGARQLHLTAVVKDIGPLQVDVELLMTEQVEGGRIGVMGERPLREHGLYDSYYAALQKVIESAAQAR